MSEFFNVVHRTTMQLHVPSGAPSTVSSISMLGSLVAVPLGLALAGPVAEIVGTTAVLTAGAIWVGIAGITMAVHPASRSLTPTR